MVGCLSQGWDYAYTAQDAEHTSCDAAYVPGSAVGIATFTFPNVAAGDYDVFIQGRHTTSRNPNGAKVIVNTGSAIHEKRINQRDNSFGYPLDLHGTYCLSGTVTVTIDSSEPNLSDSIQNVYLTPAS